MICIDGNIGAGKTSILKKLHNDHKYLICEEPIDKWSSYLKDIYDNKKGYYDFQVKVWSDRCFIQEKSEKRMFFERSPYFTRNTFIEYLYNNEKISKEEYDKLNQMYDITDGKWKPDKYFYIKVSSETCYNRILRRNREFEKNIKFDYIKELNDLYEKTYTNGIKKGVDIIKIDGEKITEEIVKEILENIE
jgi:deoxyadenosine/deoxycytidine kinase